MEIHNFKTAKNFLNSLIPTNLKAKFPAKTGLERTKKYLKLLDNPQEKFFSIHITGTSGKGSTAYFIANILIQAGYKVGLFVSPHIEEITERIQINGRPISKRKFTKYTKEIAELIEKYKQLYGAPTYFETLTLIGFLAFSKEKVEVTVIEVGLGGKYDSTNTINGKVCIFTNVSLEHTKILGNTLKKITNDKMQIIKKGCQFAVCGVKRKGILNLIKKHCKRTNTKLLLLNKQSYKILGLTPSYTTFRLKTKLQTYSKIKLKTLGKFQVENASLAILASEALNKLGLKISKQQVQEGLENTFIPGRFEIVEKKRPIILDVAHNPAKIKAFVETFRKIYPEKKATIVFAAKKDKKILPMLSHLNKIAQKFIFTQAPILADLTKSSTLDPSKIARVYSKIHNKNNFSIIPDALEATSSALEDKNLPIVITGSFYLIGKVRKFLLKSIKGTKQ